MPPTEAAVDETRSPTTSGVATSDADSKRARRIAGWLSLVGGIMLGLGLLLGLLSIVMAFPAINFTGFTAARELTVPAVTERTLEPDTYVVFQSVPASDPYTTLGPENVTVVGPDGAVPVTPMTVTETLTLGENEYLGAVRFDAQSAGQYTITINPAQRTQVIVMPSLSTTFLGIAGWVALGVVSWVAFYLGAMLLVVGLIWRSTAPMLAQSTAQQREVRAQLAAQMQGQQEPSPLLPDSAPPAPATPVVTAQAPFPTQPPMPYPQPQPEVYINAESEYPAQPSVATAAEVTAAPPPAGWYVDPGQSDRWRYWDGTRWTAHHS